jgi:hypothetical protein
MDFAGIDKLRKKIMDRILGFAREVSGAAGVGDSD